MGPQLSIVIPTLNEEHYLPKLLDSIRAQDFTGYEVIVADAGSLDRTVSIARGRGLRVVGGGIPARGRNEGVKVAQGDMLLFLDADVILPQGFLRDNLCEFERRHLDVASCFLQPLDEQFKFIYQVINASLAVAQFIHPQAPGCCILIKREIHESIGGFDERIEVGEDLDYVRRASQLGRFRFLKSHRVLVSSRRFEGEKARRLVAKLFLVEFCFLFLGGVRGDLFDYRRNQRHSQHRVSPWV